jgi:hypothetical protein
MNCSAPSCKLLIVAAWVFAAACGGEPSAPLEQVHRAEGDLAMQAQNEANRVRLESIIAEVDPHIRYDVAGNWTLDASAHLSAEAAAFVQAARQQFAVVRAELNSVPASTFGVSRAALYAPANQSGITFFWWGARIAMPTNAITGVSAAWRLSGGAAAVRVFLSYYGWSGWAVGAAGVLVPAYAFTIDYVDRLGGRRGVFLNTPWTIIPTYIAPQ